MSIRKAVITLAFALILSSMPQIALADTPSTYNDVVAGRELFATSTLGVFAGTAAGDLPGTWTASIYHTPLTSTATSTATITGGSFALATSISGSAATVNGTFSGGTVTQIGASTGCSNQTYAVAGALSGVGVGGGSGTGSFSGTLTHYRYLLWGSFCITYKATIVGAVQLIY